MGQPGNSSINHAYVTNYWNNNYSNLKPNAAYSFFFIEILKQFLRHINKYGHYLPALLFYSHYFYDSNTKVFKIDENRFFRRKRKYSRRFRYISYYRGKRRIVSYLNTKYSLYRYLDWLIVYSFSFKVFKVFKNTPKLRKRNNLKSLKFQKILFLKFNTLLALKTKQINLNQKFI